MGGGSESLICCKEVIGTLTARDYKGIGNDDVYQNKIIVNSKYQVRRLTPTECASLQGMPDWWVNLPKITSMSDKDYEFWCENLFTLAKFSGTAQWNEAMNCYTIWQQVKTDDGIAWTDTGNPYKNKTKNQIINWYNKLHSDSAEYKMWGNGMALPCMLFVMEGIAEALRNEIIDILENEND